MDPFTVEVVIARPREEVFEYLADIANHPEFCDHYLVKWHLTREDSYGTGAGARYRIKLPVRSRYAWADSTFTEVVAPRTILERGRAGKYNRILTRGVYELEDAGAGTTRVRFTLETKRKLPTDAILEGGPVGRLWMKRQSKKSLNRLRAIFEEGRDRGTRATVAGGPRKPTSAFRFQTDVNR
ncbi:hypothetical protein DSM104299_04480 [Baekduia alba]|uniref:SRPBCC family protein n=1 Tax=Baekduia alba TaxID=2997333 RepID=UPI00234260DC|nr:SRPBCC family protein [Baekduia alba]WCB95731.1 hypothetical protein DSM104299_04480 [Baekduia alba]